MKEKMPLRSVLEVYERREDVSEYGDKAVKEINYPYPLHEKVWRTDIQ
jgi:hypothetical protein